MRTAANKLDKITTAGDASYDVIIKFQYYNTSTSSRHEVMQLMLLQDSDESQTLGRITLNRVTRILDTLPHRHEAKQAMTPS